MIWKGWCCSAASRPTYVFRLSHTLNLRPYETRQLVGARSLIRTYITTGCRFFSLPLGIS